jgi:hypothetical protein
MTEKKADVNAFDGSRIELTRRQFKFHKDGMGNGCNDSVDDLSFGSIRIDGVAYEHDVVVYRGKIRKRRKPAQRCLPRSGRLKPSAEPCRTSELGLFHGLSIAIRWKVTR